MANPLDKFDRNLMQTPGGHFCTIVWKATTHIGCAMADCPIGDWPKVLVCNYQQPGKLDGQYADNVFPSGS